MMGKKTNFVKNMTVGLKAMGGAIIHYFIMFLIIVFTAFIVGGYTNIGPGLMILLVIVLVLTGILVLGWVYRALWKWK